MIWVAFKVVMGLTFSIMLVCLGFVMASIMVGLVIYALTRIVKSLVEG